MEIVLSIIGVIVVGLTYFVLPAVILIKKDL